MRSDVIGRVRKDYFLYALLLFLLSFLILPTSKMVNNVYYVFLALPAFYYIVFKKFSIYRLSLVFVFWIALLLVSIVSGFVYDAGMQYYKHILYVFLFLTICAFLIKGDLFYKESFFRISFWVVIFYVVVSTVFYWVAGKYDVGERVIWLPSRMSGPIYTSMLISALFSSALPAWINNKSYYETLLAISVSLFCMSFVLQSRSGIVALLFVTFVYIAYLLYARYGIKYIFLFFVGSFFAVGLLLFFSESIPALNKLVSRADAGRFELWSQLLKDFKDCNKFLGCGPGFESERLIRNTYPILHPHSIYFSLLVYTGILSLIIFLLIVLLVLYEAFVECNYWGLYLLSSVVALNFDGSHIIGNPDELWVLLLLPVFMIMGKTYRSRQLVLRHN